MKMSIIAPLRFKIKNLKDLRFVVRNDNTILTHIVNSNSFLQTKYRTLFHEFDHKGGYINKEKISKIKLLREGLKELKGEIKLWKEEVKDHFLGDPLIFARPGEIDVAFSFHTPELLDKWVTTSDSDHGEGKSFCSLVTNEQGRGVFSGELNLEPPKDGRIKKAGYCNMRTKRARKSFKRESYYDWTLYNMMVFRVRGDGRPYMINLSSSGFFDNTWNDVFQYVLHTRGGPYWQVTKIPFSKFILTSKGRVQDRQGPLPAHQISHVGISAGDRSNGPFRLEIDYIGLEFDPGHTEEFAYEMYKVKQKYIVAT